MFNVDVALRRFLALMAAADRKKARRLGRAFVSELWLRSVCDRVEIREAIGNDGVPFTAFAHFG